MRDLKNCRLHDIIYKNDEWQGDDGMAERQVKSRERVADHGEVFTAEREVNAMLDLVKQETERVDSRFLESKTRYLIQFNDSPLRGVA